MSFSSNKLSDSEFIQYLWINNLDTDPIVARLIEMAADAAAYKLVFGDSLDEAEIKYNDLVHHNEEQDSQLNDMQAEIDRLSSRTIIDLLKDMQKQFDQQESVIRGLRHENDKAVESALKAQRNEAHMKSKLDTWNIVAN